VRTDRAREAGGDLGARHCTRDEERCELERADVLIAMQHEEAATLKQMCPECNVIVAGHACPVPAAPLQSTDTKTLLFAANLYDPNLRGIQNFLRDVWPPLRAHVRDAELLICGRVCEGLSNPPDGVRFMGYVSDLEWIYKRSAVLINPVPYSTGLSVKVCEALARGRCVVAYPAGVRGLNELPNLPVDVVDSTEDTVQALTRLLTEPKARAARELRAWEWAKHQLAPEAVYKPIVDAIVNRSGLIRP
jgi:glycosyltransferase involved in cell wall biosynthesis